MKTIEWRIERVRFLDQTRLPIAEEYVETSDYRIIVDAIRTLKVRGAPLIGIAAAYGAALAAFEFATAKSERLRGDTLEAIAVLESTRPTAVNLSASLRRIRNVMGKASDDRDLPAKILVEAEAIHREDESMCSRIGVNGAALLTASATILTHCNAGALATGGIGTALGIITTAASQRKSVRVYVGETRPLLQGARLTAWELLRHGIEVTVITDSAVAFLLQRKKIDAVIIGADRIASNGDVANKIGSYGLALAAREHQVPFYVAAPTSTIDASIAGGSEIPIEERDPTEVSGAYRTKSIPEGAAIWSPAFDVTPASLVTAIITEHGVFRPPFRFGPRD